MYEVFCSHCNEKHDPKTSPSTKTQKSIVPGKQIWIPQRTIDFEETFGGSAKINKNKKKPKFVKKGPLGQFGKNLGNGPMRRTTQVVRGKPQQNKNKPSKPRKQKQIGLEEKNEEQWELGTVLSRCGSLITVGTNEVVRRLIVIDLEEKKTSEHVSTEKPKCLPANETVVSDMTELHYTHEPAILHNLKQLFAQKKPYSFVGGVLVSINPMQELPEPEFFSEDDPSGELEEPHPRTVAEKAFKRMAFGVAQKKRELNKITRALDEDPDADVDTSGLSALKVNQSILIAGESGSGKTEAAKRVLSQLVEREGFSSMNSEYNLSNSFISQSSEINSMSDFAAVQDFQDRLIGSDPILESFGNATTVRNPNSSRFGKFMKLNYEPSDEYPTEPLLYGAQITTYLLEKSRVTFQEKGEKNYRIFYQLLTSPFHKLKKHLGFPQAGYWFNYLGQKQFTKADEDRVGYIELRTALRMANLEANALKIFQVVGAVLHLGNIEFVPRADNMDAAQVLQLEHKPAEGQVYNFDKVGRGTNISRPGRASSMNTQMLEKMNEQLDMSEEMFQQRHSSIATSAMNTVHRQAGYSALSFASRLLGLEKETLEEFLTVKKMNFGGKNMEKPLNIRAAELRRDALAKHIYSLLFDYIVKQLNEELEGEPECPDKDACTFIGVLDIFGFEKFQKNGLEQLLINYANEVLLALFTREILIGEQEVYKEEDLYVHGAEVFATSGDNESYQHCLHLFEGQQIGGKTKNGIFAILDSQMKVPSPSDEKFLQELHKNFGGKGNNSNPAYAKPHPSLMRENFVVKHYASEVQYSCDNFLGKNNLVLPPETLTIFSSSTHSILRSFKNLPSFSIDSGEETTKAQNIRKKNKKKKRGKSSKATVTGQFSSQMKSLNQTLSQTGCSYIRCVKPNSKLFFHEEVFNMEALEAKAIRKMMQPKKPKKRHTSIRSSGYKSDDSGSKGVNKKSDPMSFHGKRAHEIHQKAQRRLTIAVSKQSQVVRSLRVFDETYVSLQLRNLGIYNCVNVLKGGLSTRLPYSDFTGAFGGVVSIRQLMRKRFTEKTLLFHRKLYVETLLKWWKIPRDSIKLGNKRVFFHSSRMESIDEMFNIASKLTKEEQKEKMQRTFAKFYREKRTSLFKTKALVVGVFLRNLARSRKASILQRAFRLHLSRLRLQSKIEKRKAAVMIQKHARSMIARAKVHNLLIVRQQLEEELRLEQERLKKEEEERLSAELARIAAEEEEEERKRLEEEAAQKLLEAPVVLKQPSEVAPRPETDNEKVEEIDVSDVESLREEFKSTFNKVPFANSALKGNLKNFVKRSSVIKFNGERTLFHAPTNLSAQSEEEKQSVLAEAEMLFKPDMLDSDEGSWNNVENFLRGFQGDDNDLNILEEIPEDDAEHLYPEDIDDLGEKRNTLIQSGTNVTKSSSTGDTQAKQTTKRVKKRRTSKKPSANSRRRYKELRRSYRRSKLAKQDLAQAREMAAAMQEKQATYQKSKARTFQDVEFRGTVIAENSPATLLPGSPASTYSKFPTKTSIARDERLNRKLRKSFEDVFANDHDWVPKKKPDASAAVPVTVSQFTKERIQRQVNRSRSNSQESKISLLKEAEDKSQGNFVERMASRWNSINPIKRKKRN
eukprot:maker-scaffold_5-snap-gene-16.0-mRNA-1 protein AED:0.41 eAED:0.42 QI:0/0/0/1/1/1/3/0/1627